LQVLPGVTFGAETAVSGIKLNTVMQSRNESRFISFYNPLGKPV
jgi:hypothetical protein